MGTIGFRRCRAGGVWLALALVVTASGQENQSSSTVADRPAGRPAPAAAVPTTGLEPEPGVTGAGEWRSYGRDPGGTRFSPLAQITRTNVSRLQRAWTYRIGEAHRTPNISPDREPPAFECTPLVIDGVLYLVTPSSRAIALDAETGREIWTFDPQAGTRARGYHQHRGLSYWEGPAARGHGRDRRVLYGTLAAELICLDADTGRPCAGFGTAGRVDLRRSAAERWPDLLYAVTSPPAIFQDRAIVGARVPESPSKGPSGVVRAFDVKTGALAWQFDTVPGRSELGHDTWEGDSWRDRTGVNAWSVMSVDVERGLVFVPLGSAAYDFYGADRRGTNLFANSLVALDAGTGRRVWHYQMVRHDIWDYDLPAQPILVTLERDGRALPAVVQVTKMGLIFVLHRETGEPLFPVEDRSVPESRVPGEAAWPTQPFPATPPPLVRHSITRDDISTVSPESQKYCAELFESTSGGRIYTPIGTDLTLMVPGTLGGATWSGGSFDPRTSRLYVNVNERALVIALGAQPDEGYRIRHYRWFVDERGRPCQQPPWGTLHAVDLNTGDLVWTAPLGVVDELEARGVPRTDLPSLGGSIVTAGGLVFIAGSTDRRMRAFDSETGEELWVASLEASGHATPATYLGPRSGRQYVVIAAGGGGYLSPDDVSDAVVAFALPPG